MAEEVDFILDTNDYTQDFSDSTISCGGESPCSMSEPDIVLTIPQHLCRDYLGIMALDVLHDAKGHGYLAGHKLSQLTDLLTEAILISNEGLIDSASVSDYVFQSVLEYFLELWSNNTKALGLPSVPAPGTPIEQLRAIVTLPFRNVAGREDEDTFISLGRNKYGIEAQNYHDQRNKLRREHAETMTFISPKGVNKPSDYFRQAAGMVDIIKARTLGTAKIVLDMKSAAGLIRTLTDPLGYTTGLPTYADPGYNMPGMSAIRQHAEIAFLNQSEDPNEYSGPKEFRYRVQLAVPFHAEPLILLDTTYFYGVAKDGLNRSNVMISILNDHFKSKLPRSMMMAEALGTYLQPSPTQVSATVGQALSAVEHITWDYYKYYCPPTDVMRELESLYNNLHEGHSLPLSTFIEITGNDNLGNELFNWCNEENTIFRTSYVLATIRNMYFFNIQLSDGLLPSEMITETLPKMMYDYITGQKHNVTLLAFSHHQLLLLQQFIGKPTPGVPYQADLASLLKNQWLPKRKGKLTTQISKQASEWRKEQIELLIGEQHTITAYLQQLYSYCTENLGVLLDIQHEELDDPRYESFLGNMPEFQTTPLLDRVLTNYLHFYQPDMYYRTTGVDRRGLLMATLLDTMLTNKPLLESPIDLQMSLIATVNPGMNEYRHDYKKQDALQMVLGKFSGDFGQIMWSICHGHIFASEDNNTSAMALMLHRLPKSCIQTRGRTPRTPCGWGNIHGLGDGSCVDVTLDN